MTITAKQKKIIWIAAGALAVVYYAPALFTTVHSSTPARPWPFATVPTPVLPPPAFRGLLGNYNGRARLARGLCTLHFELRAEREHPGSFLASSTLTCAPSLQNAWMRKNSVTSVILSGQPSGEDIPLKITDTIAAANCAPTAFSVKPFGMTQIIVHWEDACKGGTMIVNRGGN